MNHLAVTVLFLYSSVYFSKGGDLKCYQCNVRENSLCTEEYLNACPSNQAYDRCMTIINKTAANGFWISKKCALGPCSLRDTVGNSELGLDGHCDSSKSEYQCHYCCQGDGCNKNSAQNSFLSHILFFSLAIISYQLIY